jgi:capsular polysaccharide biosynthesis protein
MPLKHPFSGKDDLDLNAVHACLRTQLFWILLWIIAIGAMLLDMSTRSTLTAPTATAVSNVIVGSAPRTKAARNPAIVLSPAPLVDTTSTVCRSLHVKSRVAELQNDNCRSHAEQLIGDRSQVLGIEK